MHPTLCLVVGVVLMVAVAETHGQTHLCEYACATNQDRVNDPTHVPTANGCGTTLVRIATDVPFTPCCNAHDICYDTCGNV
jgi:L-aminopeptidase/D-esterase-like protein